MNVFYWFQSGSGKKHINDILVEMFRLFQSLRIRILVIWVPRDHALLEIADAGSKNQDTDDWGCDDATLVAIQKLVGTTFTLDVFAPSENDCSLSKFLF